MQHIEIERFINKGWRDDGEYKRGTYTIEAPMFQSKTVQDLEKLELLAFIYDRLTITQLTELVEYAIDQYNIKTIQK